MSEPDRTNPYNPPPGSYPPGGWLSARKQVERILAPVEQFLAIEAASGLVLMLAAVAALVCANSPWRSSYMHIWHIPVGIRFATVSFGYLTLTGRNSR